jgi:hypothetical protein
MWTALCAEKSDVWEIKLVFKENINALTKGEDLKTERGVKKISRIIDCSRQRRVSWLRR